mmetsp:Transcript_42649/g.118722  ORF Transcript_42649/g.118722 Transcript_42649/m.118722 type:complete len:312 (-) Transcript_42649:87-1022(-)
MRADMLSRLPFLRHLSISISHTVPRSGSPPMTVVRTNSTTSSLDITSQMPSQQRIRYSMSSLRGMMVHSGSTVTCCASGGRSWRCLYKKSPKARETARSPFTRRFTTLPPPASIRFCSGSLFGLWSSEPQTGAPAVARESTARESPQLPTITCVSVTIAVMAVLPEWSSPEAIAGSVFMSSSSLMKLSRMMALSSSAVLAASKRGSAQILGSSRSAAVMEMSEPPCPSKTANQEYSGFASTTGTVECASSMSTRQPCISLTPTLSPLPSHRSVVLSVLGLSRKEPIAAGLPVARRRPASEQPPLSCPSAGP